MASSSFSYSFIFTLVLSHCFFTHCEPSFICFNFACRSPNDVPSSAFSKRASPFSQCHNICRDSLNQSELLLNFAFQRINSRDTECDLGDHVLLQVGHLFCKGSIGCLSLIRLLPQFLLSNICPTVQTVEQFFHQNNPLFGFFILTLDMHL